MPAVASAEAGTAAVSWVADAYVVVRAVPLKFTTEPLIKLVPVTVRVRAAAPAPAVLGVMLAIVGIGLLGMTVNMPVLVAVPPGVVTVMRPLLAPAGTMKVRVVAFTTVKPLIANSLRNKAVAPVKSVPVTVTVVPAAPEVGVKLVMVGTAFTPRSSSAALGAAVAAVLSKAWAEVLATSSPNTAAN